MSELILVLQQKTHFSLHSFEWFEEEKVTLGVTKKILLLVMWEMRCSVRRVGAIGDGGKMTSQLTNVIQELFRHSAGRSSASSRSDIAATGGHITFLSCRGSDVSDGKPTGNQSHYNPRLLIDQRMELTRTTKRHVYWFNYTVNLFMCWSDTASIYCLYLLGSLSPAVRLHSLAYSSFEVTGKMLLTFFCGFYCYREEGKTKRKWNLMIGLLDYCAFFTK